MLTEAEATKKFCPVNNPTSQHPQEMCIGSLCMAWRWEERLVSFEPNTPIESQRRPTGFCGLAGKR